MVVVSPACLWGLVFAVFITIPFILIKYIQHIKKQKRINKMSAGLASKEPERVIKKGKFRKKLHEGLQQEKHKN